VKLWELLLEADRKLDLADEARAANWLQSQPWAYDGTEPLHGWAANLHSLRDLAKRLMGVRVRPSSISEDDANDILDAYRSWFTAWLDQKPSKDGRLTKATFVKLRILPTYVPQDNTSARIVYTGKDDPDSQDPVVFWWNNGLLFWQIVFLGLLQESVTTVCIDCGRILPFSRTRKLNKPSQQERCSTCRSRKARKELKASMTEEERKAYGKDK
jgi:hypothetical protein